MVQSHMPKFDCVPLLEVALFHHVTAWQDARQTLDQRKIIYEPLDPLPHRAAYTFRRIRTQKVSLTEDPAEASETLTKAYRYTMTEGVLWHVFGIRAKKNNAN